MKPAEIIIFDDSTSALDLKTEANLNQALQDARPDSTKIIIAGERTGRLSFTLIFMIAVYLLYSASGLFQGLLGAKLSHSIVRRMREELFGKIVDLPVHYLDTHSHGDIMSRMTNDIGLPHRCCL